RGRSPRGVIAEPAHQLRDPLTVEVFAGHRDDAPVAEVQRGCQDSTVPESEYRLPSLNAHAIEMLDARLTPAVRPAQGFDDRHTYGADRGGLELAPWRQPRRLHNPSYCGPTPPSGGTQSMIW